MGRHLEVAVPRIEAALVALNNEEPWTLNGEIEIVAGVFQIALRGIELAATKYAVVIHGLI